MKNKRSPSLQFAKNNVSKMVHFSIIIDTKCEIFKKNVKHINRGRVSKMIQIF